MQTTQGTFPGDLFADVVYEFTGARLKHDIDLQLHTEDLVLAIQRPPGQDPLGLILSPTSDDVFDCAYVDDDAMVFADVDAAML